MDEDFIFYIWDDLLYFTKNLSIPHPKNKNLEVSDPCVPGYCYSRVLVFPPMHKRYRFLLHKSVQEFFPNCFSISIGLNEKRRTVICPDYIIARIVHLTDSVIWTCQSVTGLKNKSPGDFYKSQLSYSLNTKHLSAVETDSNVLFEATNMNSTPEDGKSTKHKRPDRQLYIPRAKRSLTKEERVSNTQESSIKENSHLVSKCDKLELENCQNSSLSDNTFNELDNKNSQIVNEANPVTTTGTFLNLDPDPVCKKQTESGTPSVKAKPVQSLGNTTVFESSVKNSNAATASEYSGADYLSKTLTLETETSSKCNKTPNIESVNVKKSVPAALKDNIQSENDTFDPTSWEKLFNENGDYLDGEEINELTLALGEVEIQKPKYDYLEFQPNDPDLNDKDYSHVLELYDFPPEFKTTDLVVSLSGLKDDGFSIKWVDDTHALAVFSSSTRANNVLQMKHPFMKVRPLADATTESKWKAKRSIEFLLPFKPRPQTSASLARRLVSGALGLKVQIPKEQREREKQKLIAAKESRKLVLKQKRDVWEGSA